MTKKRQPWPCAGPPALCGRLRLRPTPWPWGRGRSGRDRAAAPTGGPRRRPAAPHSGGGRFLLLLISLFTSTSVAPRASSWFGGMGIPGGRRKMPKASRDLWDRQGETEGGREPSLPFAAPTKTTARSPLGALNLREGSLPRVVRSIHYVCRQGETEGGREGGNRPCLRSPLRRPHHDPAGARPCVSCLGVLCLCSDQGGAPPVPRGLKR